MSDKKIPNVTLAQLHDALEERQKPDRRQHDQGLPEGVMKDRRKQDRRVLGSTKPE